MAEVEGLVERFAGTALYAMLISQVLPAHIIVQVRALCLGTNTSHGLFIHSVYRDRALFSR